MSTSTDTREWHELSDEERAAILKAFPKREHYLYEPNFERALVRWLNQRLCQSCGAQNMAEDSEPFSIVDGRRVCAGCLESEFACLNFPERRTA